MFQAPSVRSIYLATRTLRSGRGLKKKQLGKGTRVYHKIHENTIIGIFVFTVWKQKKSNEKCYPKYG